MPHLRSRFLTPYLSKQAKFWPAVAILGPRQSGKSTLLRDLLKLGDPVSLDDFELRNEARLSPKSFIARHPRPLIIDEVQKGPELFDSIKLEIDRKKIPGSFYLTGSTGFSSKLGIRESLTGRIGLCELLPLTLAEMHGLEFRTIPSYRDGKNQPRFQLKAVMSALETGGMPVPGFIRDPQQRSDYWKNWLDTALFRDLVAFFPRRYDPDFALMLLRRMATVMRDG